MSTNGDLEVRLSPQQIEILVTSYIRDKLSNASFEVFERELPSVFTAAGKAILNEAMLDILKAKIKEEEEKQK